MRKLGVNNGIDVRQELFALGPEVEALHLLEVQQVMVLVLENSGSLGTLTELSFTILDN